MRSCLTCAASLQASKYKDAAAVIAGTVLEDHLRNLATKAGLPTTRADGSTLKADTLNADIVKAGTCGKLDQKRVTAWLDLRNKAAHGLYTECSEEDVAKLIRDVRDFLAAYPHK